MLDTRLRRKTMNIKIYKRGMRLFHITLCLVVAITFVGIANAQEGRTDRVQQGIVRGTTVSADLQQQYGLVTLSTGCSGSLLRKNWVITAAHCVDNPDPNNPGQFITVPENSVTVTGNWRTVQTRQSARIISYRPSDIAIIRVAEPFVERINEGYNRDLYRGSLKSTQITAFGRGIHQHAQGSGASAMPSQRDGQFRMGNFTTDNETAASYSFPTGDQTIAGGDSGGPSYVKTSAGELLAGVHSSCEFTCMPGRMCVQPDVWTWVTSTPRCTDASIAPHWDDINRYLGAFVPPAQFIGTFSRTPPGYQPMWIYGIQPNGDLLWYRKDTNASVWQGPKKVGTGWGNFKDVIAAGGNRLYALTQDGKLLWYQHDGFNSGTVAWKPMAEVGSGWTFQRIFSGGDGIVYAIRQDGKLFWYRHLGFKDGARSWSEAKEVGTGWGDFKDVFSTGKGAVYAVKLDGTLLLYQQKGFETGEKNWDPPRTVGSAWNQFRQIVPVGEGVILAIRPDGALIWYKHLGLSSPVGFGRLKDRWETEVNIGSGWQGFGKVVALMPATPDVVR